MNVHKIMISLILTSSHESLAGADVFSIPEMTFLSITNAIFLGTSPKILSRSNHGPLYFSLLSNIYTYEINQLVFWAIRFCNLCDQARKFFLACPLSLACTSMKSTVES